jgi:serine-type anaerobic sulfatase-maturating enzyme
MTDRVLHAYIKQYLHSQSSKDVSIAWQGGEPTLMGLDFFERVVELVKIYKKPGQRVSFSLQTNGTLLDDAWCAFFKQHHFLVGISLDGTLELHNAYRVNKAGKGSFDQVKRGWDLLHEHQVDTNILCAVHASNVSDPLEVYHYFRDSLNARYIQFIPIVQRQNYQASSPANPSDLLQPGASVSKCSVKPDQFGTFLVDIFDEWVQQDVGQVFIQNFESAVASWCRLPSSICVFQEVCGSSLILEHNGDLFSCDHFVDPGHRLGNILEQPLVELVKSASQRQFGLDKLEQLPVECKTCDVLFACHGECPRNRFTRTSNAHEAGLNYLCPSYKLFFHHIDAPLRVLVSLLRQGRPPSEIMQMR